jgi:hypothetical protein
MMRRQDNITGTGDSMEARISDAKAYQKIVRALKNRRNSATVADISAGTGLPLQTVQELAPRVADEYSGRLEVTESGEILYSFPRGFASRYRGFFPFFKRTAGRYARFLAAAGTVLFKAWIMVMLLGYFLLFMAIALASLFISLSANSRGSDNRSRRGGGAYMVSGIFNMIIRLWFYSELTRSYNPDYRRAPDRSRPKGRPLHKAIFSFVFGDGGPDAGWAEKEKKAFIAYVQDHRGVVSLPELMVLTALPPEQAESRITALCAEFGGSPEATEEGAVVYRFDKLLLRSEQTAKSTGGIPLLFKKLRSFSANPGNMNFWFALLNGVNFLFGGYFLYNSFSIGMLSLPVTPGNGYIYRVAYHFISSVSANPLGVISTGLGLVPFVFSLLFWLIPALRKGALKRSNERIKQENFRKFCFSRIWSSPGLVNPRELTPSEKEAIPADLPGIRDKAIRQMGSYAVPEVSVEGEGEIYAFPDLEKEKTALENYRSGINPGDSALGKTIFDSGA